MITVNTRTGKSYQVPRSNRAARWQYAATAMHRMLNHALDTADRHNNNAKAVKRARDRYLGIQDSKDVGAQNQTQFRQQEIRHINGKEFT